MIISVYILWLLASGILIIVAIAYARGCNRWPAILLTASVLIYATCNLLDEETKGFSIVPGNAGSEESWRSHRNSAKVYCVLLPILPIDYHDVIKRSFMNESRDKITMWREYTEARVQLASFIVRWETISIALGILGIALVAHAPHAPIYDRNRKLRIALAGIIATTSIATFLGSEAAQIVDGYSLSYIFHPLTVIVLSLAGAGSTWGVPFLIITTAIAALIVVSRISFPLGCMIMSVSQFCVGWCLMTKWEIIRYLPRNNWSTLGWSLLVVAGGLFVIWQTRPTIDRLKQFEREPGS